MRLESDEFFHFFMLLSPFPVSVVTPDPLLDSFRGDVPGDAVLQKVDMRLESDECSYLIEHGTVHGEEEKRKKNLSLVDCQFH